MDNNRQYSSYYTPVAAELRSVLKKEAASFCAELYFREKVARRIASGMNLYNAIVGCKGR